MVQAPERAEGWQQTRDESHPARVFQPAREQCTFVAEAERKKLLLNRASQCSLLAERLSWGGRVQDGAESLVESWPDKQSRGKFRSPSTSNNLGSQSAESATINPRSPPPTAPHPPVNATATRKPHYKPTEPTAPQCPHAHAPTNCPLNRA